MDVTHWPAVRYAVSGEVQTPESVAYFHRISAAAAIRSAITDAEGAKGTSSFHILEKILLLNSALPGRYKAMANIQYESPVFFCIIMRVILIFSSQIDSR